MPTVRCDEGKWPNLTRAAEGRTTIRLACKLLSNQVCVGFDDESQAILRNALPAHKIIQCPQLHIGGDHTLKITTAP